MSEIIAIQHMACETPGTIAEALGRKGVSIRTVRIFENQPVPKEIKDADGLVIMGGPMGVYEQDRHPFLRQEIELIRAAVQEDKPVLGVCLGSQLLAAALGAKVTKGKKKEIGWHPVRLTGAAHGDPLWSGIEASFTAFHWHGDVFDLPSGAVSLASSDLTAHQAFYYGRNAYGILFHMEVTEGIIAEMVRTFSDELREAGIDGRGIVAKAEDHLPRLQKIGRTVFDRWAGLLKG